MIGFESPRVPLAGIAALARAGAVARAWELFTGRGHAGAQSASECAVRGRLLKARARLAGGAEARNLYAEAAAAYAAADAQTPAPYLLINAASMALLAGDAPRAAEAARQVLARLDCPAPLDDTPYFLAATRAEALLLLGDQPGAAAALQRAIMADPDGWDDRATTIAQLAELCAALGLATGWLDRFRPPAALHFAGHMGLAPGGAGEGTLAATIDALLAECPVGFAHGALAAGTDLVLAERLLAHGAELHLVLPAPAADFRRQSVAPAGADWLRRYDAMLESAASTVVVGPPSAGPHDPLATALAAEVAIGATLAAARRYATTARQWVVLDEAGGGANSAAQAARWPMAETRRIITLPRDGAATAAFPAESPDPGRRDAVVLALRADLAALGELPASHDLALLGECLDALGGAGCLVASRAGAWDLLFDHPAEAARAALAALQAARQVGVALSAGLARGLVAVGGVAQSARVAAGPPLALAERLALRAPAGVALADAVFAVTGSLRDSLGWQVQP